MDAVLRYHWSRLDTTTSIAARTCRGTEGTSFGLRISLHALLRRWFLPCHIFAFRRGLGQSFAVRLGSGRHTRISERVVGVLVGGKVRSTRETCVSGPLYLHRPGPHNCIQLKIRYKEGVLYYPPCTFRLWGLHSLFKTRYWIVLSANYSLYVPRLTYAFQMP